MFERRLSLLAHVRSPRRSEHRLEPCHALFRKFEFLRPKSSHLIRVSIFRLTGTGLQIVPRLERKKSCTTFWKRHIHALAQDTPEVVGVSGSLPL